MLLCCSVWPCVLRPCLPCTPAWLLTHSIFTFLRRVCIYSRMAVPRNYLPINTLTPIGTVPGIMNGCWCIHNPAPLPFNWNNSEECVWYWFPEFLSWCVPQLPKWLMCMMMQMQALLAFFPPLTHLSTPLPGSCGLSFVIDYFICIILSGSASGWTQIPTDTDKRIAHNKRKC